MTPKEALDNIAIISEILVDVSKSHIMPNKAINEIRKLDVAEIYFLLIEQIKELERLKVFKATFDKYELSKKQDFIAYENWQECEKELEELKRDVKRYFELWEQAREKWGNGLDDVEAYEFTKLHIKLSKVGNEE